MIKPKDFSELARALRLQGLRNVSPIIPFQQRVEAPITQLNVSVCTIPTDRPESDGTYEWKQTTVILVEVKSGHQTGIGLTYGSKAIGRLIEDIFKPALIGKDALDIPRHWTVMNRLVRNIGRPGIASMAIAAVDIALWDLKSKLLGLALHHLLGAARDSVPIYGSGGFTSYSIQELEAQLGHWVESGIPRVKMKIGRDPDQDPKRVQSARRAIGDQAELFVDANGAYERRQALVLANRFSDLNVSWFEEPVSSDDLEGLRMIREHVPSQIEVAAGEYGFTSEYFARMMKTKSVDVIQADVTRCGGISGFLKILDIAEVFHYPVSCHCAPALHMALGCYSEQIRHIEYFHDHVRIEHLLFEGVLNPVQGRLVPNTSLLGLGLILKKREVEKFAS